jgi:hypothetical protein
VTRGSLTAREKARLKREREWLEAEVAAARSLSDADRVRILRDLWRTAVAIRAGKTKEELERDDQVRQELDRPGKDRYRALVERLA